MKRLSLIVVLALGSALAATAASAAGVGDTAPGSSIGSGVGAKPDAIDGTLPADRPLDVIEAKPDVDPGEIRTFGNAASEPGDIRTMTLGNADKRAGFLANRPAMPERKAAPEAGEIVNALVLDNAEKRAGFRNGAGAPSGGVGNTGNHFGQLARPDNGNRYGVTRTMPARINRPR